MSGFDIDLVCERAARGIEPFRLEVSFRTGGGITVVFGASGAGKSTLLLTVLGALRPRQGSIVLGDRVLFEAARGVSLSTRERRIGIVFQDALLFPHLDALENVAFGLKGRDRDRIATATLARVEGSALARRRPSHLSGGERQRVALARALAPGPDALFLDEPFSALDAPSRETLGSLVRELQAERQIPFLHVTHDLAEAMRLGSQVVVLDQGRVIHAGSPMHLLDSTRLRLAGSDNLFAGSVVGHLKDEGYTRVDLGGTVVETAPLGAAVGDRVVLRLPSEDILVSLRPVGETSARNVLAGELKGVRPYAGGVEVEVATPVQFRALLTQAAVRELRLAPGQPVYLLVKAHSFRSV